MNEQAWINKSREILTDIKEWRRAHPKATFIEIEDEVHKRMMHLEAQVLQDAAQASASREWGQTKEAPAPLCPKCATPLQARGKRERRLQGNGGESVTLSRTYGVCSRCGHRLFPLDKELALLPGHLAPRLQEHLVHLAAWMPFERAAQMLGVLLGVQTSPETARRRSEQMGAWMDAAQTEEVASTSSEKEERPALAQCVLSVDGAMISLVKNQWVEVRTLAIGEPQEKQGSNGEREVHTCQLSYFSQLADASTFTERAGVEMRRRRVAEAKAVCAVTDGVDWCQTFSQSYRPDAVRILDFPHAAEHLSHLLEALKQAGLQFPEKLLERCLHILKHRGPRLSPAPPLPSLSCAGPAEGHRRACELLAEARATHAVSNLSRPGVAYWVGDGGECEQKCRPGTPQRTWNALREKPCQLSPCAAVGRL